MVTKGSSHTLEQLLDHLSARQFLSLLPGHVFVKDKEGVCLANNQSGQLNAEGKTDFDMPWKNDAKQLRENDKLVMDSQKEIAFTEKLRLNGKDFATFRSVKAPLFDEHGDVIGIIGFATQIEG